MIPDPVSGTHRTAVTLTAAATRWPYSFLADYLFENGIAARGCRRRETPRRNPRLIQA